MSEKSNPVRKRNAGKPDVPCISLYNGSQNYCVSIDQILSGQPLPDRYDDVKLLEITLQVKTIDSNEAS